MVVLHGLLGSSRNWITVAKDLSEHFDVSALDLRNHGESPHHDEMGYEALVEDLRQWLDVRSVGSVVLVGHSLGGKVAMAFACRYPERVSKLVVADIAPKRNPAMTAEFAAMNALELESLSSRAEAEERLAASISDLGMRRFLLTNLERAEDGGFFWKVNLPVLTASLADLADTSLRSSEDYQGPTLFVRGGHSRFVLQEDAPVIRAHFPDFRIVTLPNAGHNVHIDDRPGFVSAVREFVRLSGIPHEAGDAGAGEI